jgi:putative glycerol-1-phosphate prenyltransferase
MHSSLLASLEEKSKQGIKSFALLIDPDNIRPDDFSRLLAMAVAEGVDYLFVGGSLIVGDQLNSIVRLAKEQSELPVILFPGSNLHIDTEADAILLLSLISGRNADLLIGQHIIAAPILKRSRLEILPTGYMLVESGRQTTVSYISNTTPIPHDKASVAACTAMAGEMLGLGLIYMDGGSGAEKPISNQMIQAVRKAIDCPLIVGGGLNSPEKALEALKAGADVVVVGNAIEQEPQLLSEIAARIRWYNEQRK